jgi:hypothetical protein
MISHGAASEDLPIIQYWHSEDVPDQVTEALETFRDRNPGLQHLVFSRTQALELISGYFTPREVAAFRSCAVPAMQADYFRYCAVLALGGVYADVSFRCLRSLRTLIDAADRGVLFRQSRRQIVINGLFLFTAPGSPLLRLALEIATVNIERRAAEKVSLVTGPWVFTGLAALHQLGSLDAAREHTAGQVDTPLVDSLLQAVGDYERVAEAFEGIRISPLSTAGNWIGNSAPPLQYKQSETRWVDWHEREKTIFSRPEQ